MQMMADRGINTEAVGQFEKQARSSGDQTSAPVAPCARAQGIARDRPDGQTPGGISGARVSAQVPAMPVSSGLRASPAKVRPAARPRAPHRVRDARATRTPLSGGSMPSALRP